MARLPSYVPRDDAAKLTGEEDEALDASMQELGWAEEHRLSLVPFMRDAEWDETEVVARATKLKAELDEVGLFGANFGLPSAS